ASPAHTAVQPGATGVAAPTNGTSAPGARAAVPHSPAGTDRAAPHVFQPKVLFNGQPVQATPPAGDPQGGLKVPNLCNALWTTYNEASVDDKTIYVGEPRLEHDLQPQAYHGASCEVNPALFYVVDLGFDLCTWDSYNGGYGYWDGFIVSITDRPYPELPG